MICVTIFMTENRKIVHSKTLTFSGHHTQTDRQTDRKCNPYVSQPLRGETKIHTPPPPDFFFTPIFFLNVGNSMKREENFIQNS